MLTVLLATRNRSQILRDVLEAYTHLQAPPGGWKLVVVDNHSTDQTARVVASFADRLPVRYLFEQRLGKNFALNAGLALVEGDLTVLTDDDAFPRADWLQQLRKTADSQPTCSIFGGPVVPRWEVPPPEWLKWLDLGPIFTITPQWLKTGELPPELITWVQGPNMAIRTDIFRSGIRFDTSIGPSGLDYAMGSETELLLRLGRNGHRAWHVEGAVVEHFVRKDQLRKQWVLRRAVRWGRGKQRLFPDTKLWWSVPRYLLRDLPKEVLRMALAAVTFRQRALFLAHWRFNYLLGRGIEARSMAVEKGLGARVPRVVRRPL